MVEWREGLVRGLAGCEGWSRSEPGTSHTVQSLRNCLRMCLAGTQCMRTDLWCSDSCLDNSCRRWHLQMWGHTSRHHSQCSLQQLSLHAQEASSVALLGGRGRSHRWWGRTCPDYILYIVLSLCCSQSCLAHRQCIASGQASSGIAQHHMVCTQPNHPRQFCRSSRQNRESTASSPGQEHHSLHCIRSICWPQKVPCICQCCTRNTWMPLMSHSTHLRVTVRLVLLPLRRRGTGLVGRGSMRKGQSCLRRSQGCMGSIWCCPGLFKTLCSDLEADR